MTLKGLAYLPCQDTANGRIAACEVFCSNNPTSWPPSAAMAKWKNSNEVQTVNFKQPLEARYLKVLTTCEVNKHPFAAIAGLDVVTK